MPEKIQPSPCPAARLFSGGLLWPSGITGLPWLASPLLGFLGLLRPITGNVQLHDHAVMHQPIDGRCRRHGIFEDAFPARKRQITRQQHAASLVPLRQQYKQHFHLLPALLHIAQVIQDQHLGAGQPFQHSA